MADATFTVLVSKLDGLEARIAKLNRRALRLGCSPIAIDRLGDPRFEERQDLGSLHKYRVKVQDVRVQGESPILNGWRFLARIEPVEGAAEGVCLVLRASDADVDLSAYRVNDLRCEHCALDRKRHNAYVLQHEDGTLRQVGRSCLKDFTGHAAPEQLAALAELLILAREACEEGFDADLSEPSYRYYLLEEVAALTAAVVRADGWVPVSSGRDDCTRETVSFLIAGKRTEAERARYAVTEEDLAEAALAVTWAENLDGRSDFEWNLSALAGAGAVRIGRSWGLAVALLPSYRRAVGREIERQQRAATSAYVGTVGRREVFTLTLVDTREFDGNYGVTTLHKFLDANGSDLIWWASKSLGIEQGATVLVKGTVKKHEERNGVKQTVLSRCALVA